MTPAIGVDALSAEDRAHLARALELAARGLYTTDPNPRVGCVLVRSGAVLGEGWHERAGEAHAEVTALRAAGGAGAAGATAYVTLEPCSHTGRTPPCADALIAAGIRRIVCCSADPNPKVAGDGIKRLEAAGIGVSVGPLAGEARALNPGYFSRFERARPLIRLKLAMSLDARTAPAQGARIWISGEESRADVQKWRARSSAILTGAGTVRADDPRLDVRLNYGPWVRQPLRVLLDPTQSCAPSAKIFAGGGALVFISADAAQRPAAQPPGAQPPALAAERPFSVELVPAAGRGLDLKAVIERLTLREVNELWVECGPRLAAAFLEASLVDEVILYVAPILLGADAPPLTALSGLAAKGVLPPSFEFASVERVGADLRLILTPRIAIAKER
ncbi:MAG TPA: bifunctional diaminohydroxyphosphoribosylaminopyrimidine deaminase/5-amino-6-(5-phosphoribosylamino)uracil reductase RibD [Steroidobacteraceae bacterium]|nr:bifunctional diaminohydroxyphosphoribosylaminopyrimidine deaminase/5-amino-6-(5-phosphoribosylamino)uracil reductase RibD [Steroidobacteraceae bacterium]